VFKRLVQVLLFCLCLEGALTVAGVPFPFFRDPLSLIGSRTEQVELYTAFEGGGGQRAIGTFYDYAVTAAYLTLLLPLALSEILLERRFVWKWAFLLMALLGLAGIWLTYSRAGLLAALVAVGLWVCLSWLRGFLTTRKMLGLVYAATVVVVLASPLFFDFFLSRPTMTWARLPLWARGVTMTVDNPVFGVGLNNSTAVKRELFTPTSGTEDWSQPIHNYYLVVSSETGLVGFVLFFGFFFLVGREAFKLSEPARGRFGTTSVAITSAYVAVGVALLTQTISHTELAMLCFFAGLIVAARELSASSPEAA
jgi:O-antigen ligase